MQVDAGDQGGLDTLARCIEIAAANGALGVLSRGYNSLAVAHQTLGDVHAAYEARLDGSRTAARLGPAETRWFDSVLPDHRYRLGEWQEALRGANEFLAAVEQGSPHYSAWQMYAVRAELRLAQGDPAGAIADADSALAAGRAVADPQAVYFVLPACAHVFGSAGEDARALPLAREFLEVLRTGVTLQFAVINLPIFAAAAHQLGLDDELEAALAGRARTPWTDAVGAYAAGDFASAAEILRRIGSKPDEADARLRAAERLFGEGRRAEADGQLQLALAFYRSVGATRYVRECEALLAATA